VQSGPSSSTGGAGAGGGGGATQTGISGNAASAATSGGGAGSTTITQTGSAQTNLLGAYSLSLLEGTYTVTASAYGYLPQSMAGITVQVEMTTTQNFTLAASYHVHLPLIGK
jgi:hypothetical protein